MPEDKKSILHAIEHSLFEFPPLPGHWDVPTFPGLLAHATPEVSHPFGNMVGVSTLTTENADSVIAQVQEFFGQRGRLVAQSVVHASQPGRQIGSRRLLQNDRASRAGAQLLPRSASRSALRKCAALIFTCGATSEVRPAPPCGRPLSGWVYNAVGALWWWQSGRGDSMLGRVGICECPLPAASSHVLPTRAHAGSLK